MGVRAYLVVAIMVFAVTFVGSRGMLSWPYQEWSQTSALFHQRLDLTGPVAAFFGAYFSGRLTPPSRVFARPKFQRDSLQFLRQNLLPLCLVIAIAYILALTPILVLTARSATYGSLDVGVALSGLIALFAITALSWLLGLTVRSAFVAPVAFALALGTTIAGYSGDTLAAIAPVLYISPTLGFHESGALVLFRTAFSFVVIVATLAVATGILSRREYRRQMPSLTHSMIWLAPVAFIVVGVWHTPALFVADSHLPKKCEEVSGVQVCVHDGHRSQLSSLVKAVRPIISAVGASNLPFDRIYDRALAGPTVRPDDSHTYYYDMSPTLPIGSNVSDLADVISGFDGCQMSFDLNARNASTMNMRLLADRIQGTTGHYPDNPFAALSDDDLRTWITAHLAPVRACAVSDSMLP